MTTTDKKRTPNARTKPCPNPIKGERCSVCGARYVCIEPWRPKAANTAHGIGADHNTPKE